MKFLISLADHRKTGSLADKMRRERFALFKSLIDRLPRPISILDVGGEEGYWRRMGGLGDGVRVLLLNLAETKVTLPGFESGIGDATNIPQFGTGEFDVVFSNSVIEHLFTWEAQQKMAKEVQRVGKRYFVQTPNKYFPVEPHFHMPFFQFYPFSLRVFLMKRFALGGYMKEKTADAAAAELLARAMRLLSRREFVTLFPNAMIWDERVFGLRKSFVAYGGWG